MLPPSRSCRSSSEVIGGKGYFSSRKQEGWMPFSCKDL